MVEYKNKFWKVVNGVIEKSDIILEILDARFVELSRNREIEDKCEGKKFIFVLNKCDLVSKKEMEKWKRKLKNCVFVSATQRYGTTLLKKKIIEFADGKNVTIGVLGYPNTGKSSVINAICGKKKARTSASSGFTKGKQLLRMAKGVFLLDTPGVYPYKEKGSKLALIGAEDFTRVKDPDLVVLELLEEQGKRIKEFYGVKGEGEEVIENIAKKLHKLKKGGELDITAASKVILKDWQRGKIII
jgi:ribosome biogenesis GTPase A